MTEPQRYTVYLKSTGETLHKGLDPNELHEFIWSGPPKSPERWWINTRHPQWDDLRAIQDGQPYPDEGNAYLAADIDEYHSSGELW